MSTLLHPWLYVAMLARVASDTRPDGGLGLADALGWLALCNLAAGYASAIALGRIAVARRNMRLQAVAWTLPLYWLAISIAAHRALIELVVAPFHWEKTAHRGGVITGQTTGPAAAGAPPRQG